MITATNHGSSVVDYMLVSHDVYERCVTFRVDTTASLLNEYNLYFHICERYKPADHSTLITLEMWCGH